MSWIFKLVAMALIFVAVLTFALFNVACASNYEDNSGNPVNPGMGPAPNFADGISDGPGW